MTRVAVLVTAIACAAVACSDPTRPDAVVNQSFQLKVGESATLPGDNWVRFDRLVSDSRCPIDAICITAGDAVIAVSFKAGHLTTEMHTDPSKSQVPYSDYVLKLTELQPYPRSDRPAKPEDYIATFIVQTQ